jgi:hypothetical protein
MELILETIKINSKKTLGKRSTNLSSITPSQASSRKILNKQNAKLKLTEEEKIQLKTQKAKEKMMNIKLIEKFLHQVKPDLSTVQDILVPLANMHSNKHFIAVGVTFCDGFGITDPILPLSNFTQFLSENSKV